MEILKLKDMFNLFKHKDDYEIVFLHDINLPVVSFRLIDDKHNLIYESPHVYESEEKVVEIVFAIVKMITNQIKIMSN